MLLEEVQQSLPALVRRWYETRVEENAKKAGVRLNESVLVTNICASAQKVAIELHEQLIDSDGIDCHKVATAFAFSVGQYFGQLFVVPDVLPFERSIYKDNCRVDCALSVYFGILLIDREKVEAEPVTIETIRTLFRQVTSTQFPYETRSAILFAMSTIAFLMERTYPDISE